MAESESYRQIFKSSAILGSARVMNMLIGMVRIKVMALLLGPVGVGLFGIYESIVLMVSTFTGLGVSRSGVREVAQASGSGNIEKISGTVKTVQRIVFLLGVAGMVAMAVFAVPLSRLNFDNNEHALPIALLSGTVLVISMAGSRSAIVQGLGRIGDLAKLNLSSAAIGSVTTIILIALFREKGIVPSILSIYGANLLSAWWYERKLNLPKSGTHWKESLSETGPLIGLGLSIMNAALLSTLVAYAARTLISRDISLSSVGIYLCAFALSGKFVNIVIEAMWTDFYPRASSAANDDATLNRLVNEQTEISLLLAVPGLLATIFFASVMIWIFYSNAFSEATSLIRWFTMGGLIGVISGPMKIVQLAKGKSLIRFLTETGCSTFHLILIFVLLKIFLLPGCAIAYVFHNIAQLFVSYMVAKHLSGFSWSSETIKLIFVLVSMAVLMFLLTFFLTETQILISGVLGTMTVSIYCLRQLMNRLGPEHRLYQFAAKQPLIGRLFAH